MKRAILCRNPENHNIQGFDMVYLGNEFCENLLFTLPELKAKINHIHNKRFTLVTPFVTDRGFKKLCGIFEYLDRYYPETEVVVNDFGVLDVLIKRYKSLLPVLGRVIGNHLVKGPPELRPNSVEARKFFKSRGIERCEISNKGPFRNIVTDKNLNYSLYYPYMFIATGRRCMVGFGNQKVNKNFRPYKCKRACNNSYFLIKHKQIDEPIIVYGNTHFVEKKDLPELGGINRLVYMPEGFFR